MTREEFLKRLEDGLAYVVWDERENALQYYAEYIDDAGPEHEADALKELGDPDKLAADIRAASEPEKTENLRSSDSGNSGRNNSTDKLHSNNYNQQTGRRGQNSGERAGEFPGGYVPYRQRTLPDEKPYSAYRGRHYNNTSAYAGHRKYTTPAKALIIAALVLLSPVVLSLLMCAAVLLLLPFITAVAFGFASAIAIICGILLMGSSVANSLLILGIALMLLAGTLLLVYGGVKLFEATVPGIIGWCGSVYYRFKNRDGEYRV